MKSQLILGVVFAIAHGLSIGATVAQAECTVVHFSLYDPGQDPPCGAPADLENWSMHVTSSPTGISAGSCASFALDNLYTDVDFYLEGCGMTYRFTCDIVASGSILSGYYVISGSGACMTVCDNCTP